MRRIITISLAVIFMSNAIVEANGSAPVVSSTPILLAQAANKTTKVIFDHSTWDFGSINEVDGDVSHTFSFKNEGSIPYIINSVGVSCGCTTPKFTKEPVLPGKSGQIEITFDPINRPGPFEKTISILSNDARGSMTLTIKGNVVGRPRTIKDDYPYALGAGVRVVATNQVIGNVQHGKTTTHTIGVANNSDKPVQISVVHIAMPDYVKVKAENGTLLPGQRSTIVVEMAPGVDVWGKKRIAFALLINGMRDPQVMEITTTVVENFGSLTASQRKAAPIADYSSFFYHFSNQPAGKTLTRQFTLSNSGTDPLIIRDLDPSDGIVKVKSDKTSIASGDTATITISVDTEGIEGRLSESVVVITNDPTRPAREIRIMATMGK